MRRFIWPSNSPLKFNGDLSVMSNDSEGRMREWVECGREESWRGGDEGTLSENADEGKLEKEEPGDDGGEGRPDDWGDGGCDIEGK